MKNLIKVVFTLLFIVAIVAIVGRLFFFDIGKTANYSMVPNIIPQDIFLFNTRSIMGIGDIAVCRNPEEPSTLVVGRIVGIPGDTVEIKGEHLYYNDRIIHHNHTGPAIYYDQSTEETMKYVFKRAEEKLGGRLFTVGLMDVDRGKRFRKVTVPQEHFFLLGDNRNMAHDSRNYGFVPIENCLGKSFFLLWAAPTNGDLKQSDRSFSWIR